jgi:predicted Zn finger-like uncharacterized protein
MIITCPHCQTKYQVTYEAIGSAGRKVQCAHCQQAWQQAPLEKSATTQEQAHATFEKMEEDALDEALEAEARAAAAPSTPTKPPPVPATPKAAAKGKTDPETIRKRQRDFTRRERSVAAEMPLARLRRVARIGLLVTSVGVLAGLYFGRAQVVEHLPDLAGAYANIGLPVNVVGLEFSGVKTLHTLRDGKEVLAVSAQIVGLAPRPVAVPPVLVTLLDAAGHGLYEWSITPTVDDLMAGERSTFDTQLTLPPGEAHSVRLSFAGSAGGPALPDAPSVNVATAPPAEASHEPPPASEPASHPPAEHH